MMAENTEYAVREDLIRVGFFEKILPGLYTLPKSLYLSIKNRYSFFKKDSILE